MSAGRCSLAFLGYEVAFLQAVHAIYPLRRYAGHEHYCNDNEVGQAASPNGGCNAGRSGPLSFGSSGRLLVIVQNR
jgi:hypothetical protein